MADAVARAWLTGTPEEPIINLDLPAGPKGEPGGWNIGTNLGSTDLNTVTTPGLYWNGSTVNTANPELHYPPMTDQANSGSPRGVLQVQSWSGGASVVQTYTRLGSGGDQLTQRPRVMFQRYKGTNWSEWSAILPSKFGSDTNGYRSLQVWDDESNTWSAASGPGGWTEGANLGTLDLNLVTTPGLYRQNVGGRATLVNNYPRAGDAGALTVMSWGGAGEVMQQYTTYPNQAATMANFGVFSRGSRGGSWSPWVHNPSQRVSNTAGRAIYTWDDTSNREQLIYGDTGVRDITSTVVGLSAAAPTPGAFIHRNNSLVTLSIDNLQPDKNGDWVPIASLPSGFRPRLIKDPMRIWIIANSSGSSMIRSSFMYSGGALSVFGCTTTDSLRTTITFPTADPWPTSLPGTAVGGIPNL